MSIQPTKVTTLKDGSTITLYWSDTMQEYVTVPSASEYDAMRAAATVCKSCGAYAVMRGICHRCGLDQRSDDFAKWE